MTMPGRNYSSGSSPYRYGFNTQEKSDEISGVGNHYTAQFWEYDSRTGKRWNKEPLEKKYPFLSPYATFGNNPILFSDIDGKDIIVLSAPKGAGGLGHAAVLIGNDKTGWMLYSKNGTYGSSSGSASSGPSNKSPEIGIPFKSLSEFANSSSNFHNGEVQYTSAFRITSSPEVDSKMKEAAVTQVNKWYDVTSASCVDVCTDALKVGGFKSTDEQANKDIAKMGGWGNIFEVTPNQKYAQIKKLNNGVDVTNQILPTDETKKKYKQEYEDKKEVEKILDKYKPTIIDKAKSWWEGVKSTVSEGIKQATNILSTPK